ncbi:MAG: hypothetical protein CMN30_32315 [Sandaracinus sp.]|nr:hypothetical protein [Sandaracinus sp.]
MEAKETALELVRRWHDEDPGRRRMPDGADLREVRVLHPMQIRLVTVAEERRVRIEMGRSAPADSPVGELPDAWGLDLAPVVPARMLAGTYVQTDVGTGTHACDTCAAKGTRRCVECRGEGLVDVRECPRCAGAGTEPCVDCRGTARRHAQIIVSQTFRPEVTLRVYEEPGEVIGPHPLLYLVDHPSEGEVVHDQEAPLIGRFTGRGAGGDYREAAAAHATHVDALLEEKSDPAVGRVVHQRLTLTRVPVYAFTLAGGRTGYVCGEPPDVSPPELFRSRWLSVVPTAAMVFLILTTAAFFFLAFSRFG